MSRKTRKLIWSAPLLAVLAVAGALAIFAAQSPGSAQATHEMLPGAPKNLMVDPADGAAGRTTLKLTWDKPDGDAPITGYRIDYSPDNITFMQLVDDTGNTRRSYEDSMKLKPGDYRVYRVFALNSGGAGPVSETQAGVTDGDGEPSMVTGLTAMVPTERPKRWSQINLSWNAPYNGGSDITHYCIEVATLIAGFPADDAGCRDSNEPSATTLDGTTGAGVIVTGNVETSYEHTGLVPSTTRLYRAYAVNGNGTSMKPSMQQKVRTAAAENPAPPQDVVASLSDDASAINIYWNWPEHNGGHPIVNFIVQVINQDGKFADPTLNANGTLSTASTTTLADDDIVTTLVTATAAKALIQSIVPSPVDDDTYKVRVFTHTDNDTTTDGGHRMSSDTDAVHAVRKYASGSLPSHGKTPVISPADFNAEADGHNVIDLSWTNGLNTNTATPTDDRYPASGFRIDYAAHDATADANSFEWKELESNTGPTRRKFEHKGLKAGTRIYYRIFAIGPSRATSMAAAVVDDLTEVAAEAEAPTMLTATADGAATINLSWKAPVNTGGSAIKRYEVDMSMMMASGIWADWPGNGTPPTVKQTDGPVMTYAHTGLNENSRWRYRVRAVTDSSGDWSNIDSAETGAAGMPEMPIGLVAEIARDSNAREPGDRGVLLLWNAPEGPTGSVVTHYIVDRKVEGEDDDYEMLVDTSKDDDEAMRTDYTDFDEPTPTEVRMYRVTAVSAAGKGAPAMVRFPLDLMHNSDPMATGMIDPVTVMAGAMSTPMDVSGYFSDADGDTLTYRAESDMEQYATADIPEDSNMLTITGVAEGSAIVTVYASDGKGGTDAMRTINVTVTAASTALTAPTDVETCASGDPGCAGIDARSVRITWTDGDNADRHLVALFDSNWNVDINRTSNRETDGMVTFDNVPSGAYNAVVFAIKDDEMGNAEEYKFGISTVTVP